MKQYFKNPRRITKKEFSQLKEWLRELGDLSGVVHDLNTDEIIGGNQRSNVFDVNKCEIELVEGPHEPDEQGTVALGFIVWEGKRYSYRQVRWNEKQCEKANIVANKAGGSFDFDMLANQFELSDLVQWGFDEKELGFGEEEEPPEQGEEETDLDVLRVPDAIWGTDNDYGIPLLDLNMQAKFLEAPFAGWGTMPRKDKMKGTYHFYVEDYRFEALWKDPLDVANSACASIVEPNFSVYDDMPRAVAIWQMYRKRWLARWYQSVGIAVFVDLNISERHADLRLMGVPAGWKAYATRAYSDRLDATVREYGAAVERAGTDSILFVVYGGGKKAEELSKQRGWIWYPDQQTKDAGGKKHG